MEKICSSCRYAYKDSDEKPCATCSSNYTNKWEHVTDEQIMLIKNGVFDFRDRLERRLPNALKGNDAIRVDSLITDIQREMLKELDDETD